MSQDMTIPHNVEMLTCGTHDTIEGTKLCFPMANTIFFDPKKIRPYIASQDKSQIMKQMYSIFQNVFLPAERHLVLFVLTNGHPKDFIKQVSKACIFFKQTSNNLKRWLTTSNKVNVCDVLLIPLNTSDANLFDFQQRIIELCKDLCHDYEPRVCTIYDFIPSEQSDSNMSTEDRAFTNQQNEVLCSLAKKLACIRIYVVGNEDNISNKWCQLMIENEPDNGDQNARQYDQWCTFVENEPVTAESIHNLVHHHGSSWKVTNTMPIRLDTIREDGYFLTALDRSHTTLEAREMVANIELSLWVMNYHEHNPAYSSDFQAVDQAKSVPPEPDGNSPGEINNTIQFFQADPPNQ